MADVTFVPLGNRPRWLACAPDGSHVYAVLDDLNPDGSSFGGVAVIATATGEVEPAITVGGGGGGPSGIVVSPSRDRVYVANFDAPRRCTVVSVIDTASRAVTATIPLPDTSEPAGIALSPDGKTVYCAAGATETAGLLSIVDAASGAVTGTIDIDPFPTAVAITPAGDRIYSFNRDGETMAIDTATHGLTIIDTLSDLGDGRMAFLPDGSRAYVTSEGTSLVAGYEPATDRLSVAADAPGASTDVVVTSDGLTAIVAQKEGEGARSPLIKIDVRAQTFAVARVEWPGTSDGLAVSPDAAQSTSRTDVRRRSP